MSRGSLPGCVLDGCMGKDGHCFLCDLPYRSVLMGSWTASKSYSWIFVVQSLSHVSLDCSKPGFPVLQYLLEFAQTHVCWVSDAIQPSHPLFGFPVKAFPHLALPSRGRIDHAPHAPLTLSCNPFMFVVELYSPVCLSPLDWVPLEEAHFIHQCVCGPIASK